MATVKAAHYLLGVLGLALVRHWYEDGADNNARLEEILAIVANLEGFPFSLDLDPTEHDLLTGYARWAGSYDGPNPMVAAEEQVVLPILQRLAGPGVRALDAACGTGRHAARLAELGCSVTGVDQSAEMLDVARAKVPAATFLQGSFGALPCADGEFDIAVCALALCHLPDPSAAVADLARCLGPGGQLLIADPHPAMVLAGSQAFYGGLTPGQPLTFVRNHFHLTSTWLRAFRSAGLAVDDCIEIPFDAAAIEATPAYQLYPDAAREAHRNLPYLFVWQLRKE